MSAVPETVVGDEAVRAWLRERFAELGRRVLAAVTERVAAAENNESDDDVMDEAVRLGLAHEVLYSPELHGAVDAEPGVDPIWTWSHLPKGWKAAAVFLDAVTGLPQEDLSKRGVLVVRDAAALTSDEAAASGKEAA